MIFIYFIFQPNIDLFVLKHNLTFSGVTHCVWAIVITFSGATDCVWAIIIALSVCAMRFSNVILFLGHAFEELTVFSFGILDCLSWRDSLKRCSDVSA